MRGNEKGARLYRNGLLFYTFLRTLCEVALSSIIVIDGRW